MYDSHWKAAAYNQVEIRRFLMDLLVEEILPMWSDQWEQVWAQFRARFNTAVRPRDNESLKGKFKTLHLSKKPTSDPECPPNEVRAKCIYFMVESNGGILSRSRQTAPISHSALCLIDVIARLSAANVDLTMGSARPKSFSFNGVTIHENISPFTGKRSLTKLRDLVCLYHRCSFV